MAAKHHVGRKPRKSNRSRRRLLLRAYEALEEKRHKAISLEEAHRYSRQQNALAKRLLKLERTGK